MFTFLGPNDRPDLTPAPSTAQRADSSEVAQMRADIERLYFISEALWRILREKHGIDDQEIIRQIAAIDMEDGRLDGRKAPEAAAQMHVLRRVHRGESIRAVTRDAAPGKEAAV